MTQCAHSHQAIDNLRARERSLVQLPLFDLTQTSQVVSTRLSKPALPNYLNLPGSSETFAQIPLHAHDTHWHAQNPAFPHRLLLSEL